MTKSLVNFSRSRVYIKSRIERMGYGSKTIAENVHSSQASEGAAKPRTTYRTGVRR